MSTHTFFLLPSKKEKLACDLLALSSTAVVPHARAVERGLLFFEDSLLLFLLFVGFQQISLIFPFCCFFPR